MIAPQRQSAIRHPDKQRVPVIGIGAGPARIAEGGLQVPVVKLYRQRLIDRAGEDGYAHDQPTEIQLSRCDRLIPILTRIERPSLLC